MRKTIVFAFLRCARFVRWLISLSPVTHRVIFLQGFEAARWKIGKWKAWKAFERAKRSVPAYADFLAKRGYRDVPVVGFDPVLSSIPPMDKESYVKKYTVEERCLGGAIPRCGVVIDESSGTSGQPNNWVRGHRERVGINRIVQLSLRSVVGPKPIFVINAFALGPWATGMAVSMSLVDIAILKSTGPDVVKIVNTLKLFGDRYEYVIMGYPPFLKTLVDVPDVDWQRYRIVAIYGGEGMSEGLRHHLLRYFTHVYGSYGASDLEINIGGENDFTINLRKRIIENPHLANRFIRDYNGVTPMVFQYNPLDFYIETAETGELLVTLCRASVIAPKIRYNIHDLGHVLPMSDLRRTLTEEGIDIADLGAPPTDLPLLFHYGRSDAAVAFYGSKITPLDIQQIISADRELCAAVNTFSLIVSEDKDLNKHLTLAFELKEGRQVASDIDHEWCKSVFAALRDVNQDYREASKMIPGHCQPNLVVYPFGTGPFAGRDIRLKQQYIIAG